ncbi:MAG: hypothetical protein MRY83_24700 [Flavobacteriales bacterium]|nr:hypothetical protein [Flavobacteriales bacterium]
MLKKSYLLIAILSFMSISPAFSMENKDDGLSPISIETPRKEKISQEESAGLQLSSSQQDAEQKTPVRDLKEDSPPSTKSSKKSRRWCCLFRTEDDD